MNKLGLSQTADSLKNYVKENKVGARKNILLSRLLDIVRATTIDIECTWYLMQLARNTCL